jgi:hypothetical protein
MIPMTATKGLKYAGKRLEAGEHFDAKSKNDAKVLSALGAKYRTSAISASPVQKTGDLSANTSSAALPAPGDILAPLREEYQRVIGRKPFHGWDADTLREKIAAQAAGSDNE